MFIDEIRRAITAAPLAGLDGLVRSVWAAFGTGALSEDEAGSLCEMVAARRAIPPAAPAPRRSAGSRARTPASVERRRRWAGGGWMPPDLAVRFTPSEIAALSVIAAEIALRGRCELPVGAIAGRAGCCDTIVKRAVREARRLGLVSVVERRVSACRNLPNLVTLTSSSWSSWVRFRARKLRQGGGGTFATSPESSSYSLLSDRSESAAPSLACRWAGGTGNAMARSHGGSTLGHLRSPRSGTSQRRVS